MTTRNFATSQEAPTIFYWTAASPDMALIHYLGPTSAPFASCLTSGRFLLLSVSQLPARTQGIKSPYSPVLGADSTRSYHSSWHSINVGCYYSLSEDSLISL